MIERVGPDGFHEAVARLLGVQPSETSTIQAFADQQRAAGTDLSLLWTIRAEHGSTRGPCRQSCLVAPSPGGTAAVFLSDGLSVRPAPFLPGARRLEEDAAHRDRVALLRHVLSPGVFPGDVGLVLGQALLEPEQTQLMAAFVEAGFERLAELAYLRRSIPRRVSSGPVNWPVGVRVSTLAELGRAAEADLATALERSYVDTLDCPALCGRRSVADIIVSHRAVGMYDPKLWWIVYVDDTPEGCMLLNPQAGEETTELVYIGLAPAARRRGLGRRLLQLAFERLAGGPDRTLACAVDMLNRPARRLYADFEFEHFATRVALIRSWTPAPGGA